MGLSDGPIDYKPIDDGNDTEEESPLFCLREELEDALEVLENEHKLAQHEKQPENVIAEKLAAMNRQKAINEQAEAYLCVVADELNKGEQSLLKVDRALSNAAYTFITLHSFNLWVNSTDSGRLEGQPSGAAGPKGTAKGKSPYKQLKQIDAIVKEVEKQGHQPKALPPNRAGRPGVRLATRKALKDSLLFEGGTTFDKAWERAFKLDFIAYKKGDPTPPKK